MKDKLDFSLVRALLGKQWTESVHAFRKGNVNAIGILLRVVLVAGFAVAFFLFYSRFVSAYLTVLTDGVPSPQERVFELLTVSYTVLLLMMTVGAIGAINTAIFAADDMKLLSAMPVGARSLFVSRLITIYIKQIFFGLLTLLPVNVIVGVASSQGAVFYFLACLGCFLLPLVSIALASLFALPYYALLQFLKQRFVLNFIAVTLLTAALLAVYALLLNVVKEMLLGDSVRYFFNDSVMAAVRSVAKGLYPAVWIADFMLGRERFFSGLGLAGMLLACLAIAFVGIAAIMQNVMQHRIAGSSHFMRGSKRPGKRLSPFFTLLIKDFLQIFRTPSYAFSYFSVAIVMPLMTYFCMDVGASLVEKLVGVKCGLELAVFLTLLFASLTNVFCATNISREGAMFYSVKAMPVSWRTVMFSKIVLCLLVAALTQLVSAILLGATGSVAWGEAVFLFFIGVVCSFAQICLATRHDFNHAHFSTEEDGEIKETGNVVTTVIVTGMAVSFLLGGSVLILRLALALRGITLGYLSYLIVSVFSLLIAGLSCFYLMRGLDKKYESFSGGGML